MGLLDWLWPKQRSLTNRDRELLAAEFRRSSRYETTIPFVLPGGATVSLAQLQPRQAHRSVDELKRLSGSALPTRAIKLVRDTVSGLEYDLRPKKEDDKFDDPLQLAADVVRSVLDNPSVREDDLQSWIAPLVEDLLVFDAAVWEYVENPMWVNGNDLLGLEPVPSYTISEVINWQGDPAKPRWAQVSLNRGEVITFLDGEIEYLMQRKRTYSPFGLSPLETAAEIMDGWLGVSTYQRETASNAYPAFMLYLGDQADEDTKTRFRAYWENELKGRGTPGFFGNMGTQKPESLNLKPVSDEGLYLKYQETLVRILAICFNLRPQDFGLERDVNRSTAEVSAEASLREGCKPVATLFERKFNQRLLPKIARIANNPDILKLHFVWANLTVADEKKAADVDAIYLDRDVVTIDEVRAKKGMKELDNDLGKLTKTALQELYKVYPEAGLTGIPTPEEVAKDKAAAVPQNLPPGDGNIPPQEQ